MRPFLAAIQFLTILPLPRAIQTGERDLVASVWSFPLVGLLLGLAVAWIDAGLGQVLPAIPATILVVIVLLVASGGLHFDGLCDTADGFFSSRKRERMLEIMKDSRSGPMAIAAALCVLGLKVACLMSLPEKFRFATLILTPLAGRCALVFQMSTLKYARTGGLATVFQSPLAAPRFAWAAALLIVCGWWLQDRMGLAVAGAGVTATLVFSLVCYRKIGGYTGDTLGASCELAELMPALTVLVWIHGGRA